MNLYVLIGIQYGDKSLLYLLYTCTPARAETRPRSREDGRDTTCCSTGWRNTKGSSLRQLRGREVVSATPDDDTQHEGINLREASGVD